eukprot:CAMPEP_0183822274 /NCGR_PEP_ID=MMETSP0803_2-20130417/65560_1 /TAXON_ID=195967 /ORGANISM="Crustomastix stigmata, Strain CCMP3273" /LENGTH=73 /DNA_ID=CAMNT_0026067167 /DNA_START=1829 /DNA_END=2050 /DNA_ORIENTATION=-
MIAPFTSTRGVANCGEPSGCAPERIVNATTSPVYTASPGGLLDVTCSVGKESFGHSPWHNAANCITASNRKPT